MTTKPPRQLSPAPPDAVSRVSFSPTSASLLVSTWAGTLTLHAPQTGLLTAEAPVHAHALLDAVWHSDGRALASASLDGAVRTAVLHETRVESWRVLGRHTRAARSLLEHDGLLVSAGWDACVKLWDVRAPGECAVAEADAGGKVFGAARCGPCRVVVITSAGRMRVLDLRNPHSWLVDKAPVSLTGQLRGVSASEDGKQVVVGSTEGRVAVHWLDGSARDAFSFKCHRLDGMAFPVNCVVHSARYGSFATAGADGHVSFWDGAARKRIAQYERYATSVASLDFDKESEMIAIAVSYTFEEGEKDHPPDEVHVRAVEQSHVATRLMLEPERAKQKDTVEKSDAATPT